ncbi:MAG TPA: hypothetical protein VHL10_08135, partial [Nitrososphaera sp.]|nr:hypothetical protein [Nitrososphaera sp.]
MADAGEVKAKVTIEYDGSGIKQAKEDLASLAQAAGSAGENAGQAGEKMAELDAQMSGSAESARGFSSALGELPKIAEGGTSTISEMTSALSEHQTVIAETGSAYEGLKKPVEATVTMLQDVAPQMQVISKNAQSMQEQMSSASEGFTQISTSVSQVAPLLPQYAESMHAVSESFNPSAFGLDDFVRNTEVFQEALSNPAPFSMMKEHLLETGQTWSDFTSSLSESDAAMFSEMAQRTSGSYQVLDKAAGSAQKAGAAFTEAANGANDFTAQFLGMNDAAVETNKSIKETGAILEETGKSSGGGGGLFGGLFGGAAASEDVVSPFMGFLNDVMMPLMAVQMVGYAFSAVGQAIYDSAAIAEGPAAHSYGSFTGAVDTMSASVNKAKQTFAEGFGQGTLPFLEGM